MSSLGVRGMADRPTQAEANPGPAMTLVSGLTELHSAVVSPRGSLAATYGTESRNSGAVTIWNTESGVRLGRVRVDIPPVAVRFQPGETALIVALRNRSVGRLVRWSVQALDEPGEIIYSADGITGIAISRDSRTAAVRGFARGIVLLDTVSGERSLLEGISGESFIRIAVSPHGELVVGATGEHAAIYRLGPNSSRREAVVELGQVASMDCSARLVVAASGRTVFAAWDENGSDRVPVYTAPGLVRRIALSTGGESVAVAHEHGFTIVDLASGDIRLDRRTESPINRLTFRLDDNVLITAHADNDARLWDVSPIGDYLAWQSDAPATDDLLQRTPLARALAARLRRFGEEEAPTSFLVHIDGPWGSGKTTLLRLLKEELDPSFREQPSAADEQAPPSPPRAARSTPDAWLTIDFNAWQQSKVGTPWWSLLSALRRDVARGRRRPTRWWLRMVEAWVRFRRVGAPFFLACIVLVALAAGFFFLLRPSKASFASTADIAQGIGAIVVALGTLWAGSKVAARIFLWDSAQGARLYEQSSRNPMLDVSRHFGWLIARAGKPVVFLIDDLDRCSDSYVVDLLETVQTLIRDPDGGGRGVAVPAKPPCFVVAADGAWIRRSFETTYSQFNASVGEPGQPLGYLFLDKFFQLRVRMPRIDLVQRRSYLRHLLGTVGPAMARQGADSPANADQVLRRIRQSSSEAEIVAVLGDASPEVRDRVAADAVDQLSTSLVASSTEHWLQQFAVLLPPNPRAMKRFVNDYSILRMVRTLEANAVPMAPLALWTIIETRWPSLADCLRAHPQAVRIVDQTAVIPDSQQTIDGVPADLQDLLGSPEFRRLSAFTPGGPLTAERIAACCGVSEQS